MQLRITKPLKELKELFYEEFKVALTKHICEDNNYPIYKQINYTEELLSKSSSEKRKEHIKAVMLWKAQLLIDKNRIKEGLHLCSSSKEAQDLLNTFTFTRKP